MKELDRTIIPRLIYLLWCKVTMKKIWLLTTLLICGLLLTGCNNQQYEEEFSEYWLLQWPNGTITAEDFIKAWTRIDNKDLDNWVTLVNERKICNTPETACVPVILNDDNILITPHEHNAVIEDFKDENVYLTDLETFRKVTWLKEASPEYTQNLDGQYFFDAYTKFYKTIEEKEVMLNEKLENLNNIVDINNSIWIIHDVENWTITLDNWEESITIMDKNLWTDVAWTWEESYWYYFQRWNNHGFQLNSEIKTWKDLVTRDVALQYWPNNWYDSDTQFVIMDNSEEVNRNLNLGNYFLAAVNDNLRWWSGDSEVVNRMPEYVIDQFRWDTGNPRTERKWPCPEWFHVPSFGEIHKLFKLWIDIKYPNDIEKKEHVRWMAIWDRWISTEFGNDLLLPRAWWIRFDGKATPHNQWSIWYYWMSSPWRFLSFDNNGIVEYSESYRAATFSVRCFKD